jgi:hypothetical protein
MGSRLRGNDHGEMAEIGRTIRNACDEVTLAAAPRSGSLHLPNRHGRRDDVIGAKASPADSRLQLGSSALEITFNLRIRHQHGSNKGDGAHERDVPIETGLRAAVLEP